MGKAISMISGDMDLIERLNSEFDSEREEAEKEAINLVLNLSKNRGVDK